MNHEPVNYKTLAHQLISEFCDAADDEIRAYDEMVKAIQERRKAAVAKGQLEFKEKWRRFNAIEHAERAARAKPKNDPATQ